MIPKLFRQTLKNFAPVFRSIQIVLNRLIDKDNVKMTIVIRDKEVEFEGKVGTNSHVEKLIFKAKV